MTIRLVLADDHPLLLDGLEALFLGEADFEVAARATNGRDAVRAVREERPDVLVLDLRMPELSGAEVLREIATLGQPTRIVVLTASADQDEIFEAVRLGAHGVVLKEMAPRFLIQAVRKVHAGERWIERRTMARAIDELLVREAGSREAAVRLTARELEIVRMLAAGLRNRQIAEHLHVTEGTVKVHLHNIYDKVGVESRLSLVLLAERRGWV